MDSIIIAITGSNGKTTTKEMLYHILSHYHSCSKSLDNHNSTIGLPITFLNCNLKSKYAILELGANKNGEIEKLCKIIKPNFSLITNISNAHIENFNSFDEIIATKSAIFSNLEGNGIAFVNINDIAITNLKIRNKRITFGMNNAKANYNGKLENVSTLRINDFVLNIPEEINYLYECILSVYAISRTLGITNKQFQEALQTYTIPNGRGGILIKKLSYGNCKIIDDAYNASPSSMQFGIKRFAQLNTNNNKVLIIADMLELGNFKKEEHRKIGTLINTLDVDIVLTFGSAMSYTFKELDNQYQYKEHFDDIKFLKEKFNSIIQNGDLIFIKGSRSMRLERLYS